MLVDDLKLPVIMGIGALIIKLIVDGTAWIIRIIHTGPKICIAEILILMVETKGVPNFLAHHELSPCRSIIVGSIKVCVI